MTNKTLIIYSSIDGHTIKICDRLAHILKKADHMVEVNSINDLNSEIDGFDKVIVASSIRYGKHNPEIIAFIDKNVDKLDAKKNAFISVNLVARKPNKNTPETNPYVVKFLKSIDWKPKLVEVFAGNLDYPRYSFFDRTMIQLIMIMTKGPVNPKTQIEYTDWDKVDAFGKSLSLM